MIPLLGLMFSVYLGFKGVEIWQIGLASGRDDRSTAMTIGVLSLIFCGASGVIFALIWLSMGVSTTVPPVLGGI